MSQFPWLFVNKNYLLFAILATVIAIPVGMVSADFIFEMENAAKKSNGQSSFDNIDGPQGIETFLNGTTNNALIASFDDDSVTLVNISSPKHPRVIDTLDGSNDGTGTSEGRLVLEGASSLALFDNSTAGVLGNFAVVTAFLDDGIQIIHAADSNSDTTHALYPTLNITNSHASGSMHGFNGAMDVAVFTNYTFARSATYAVVTGHAGDGVQVVNITDPEVGGKIYPLGYKNSIYANATANGGNNVGGANIDYPKVGNYGGAIPIDGAFGISIFYDSPAGNMPYAIVTGQVSDGFQIFSLNDTEKGLVPFANYTMAAPANKYTAAGGFTLLDSPTGVATWNTTNANTDRWAIITSNYTDSVSVFDLTDPGAVTLVDTMVQREGLALDGALRVKVNKIGDRHYAFVTSNGTAAAVIADGGSKASVNPGGLQIIDLYEPANIQPVSHIVDGIGDFTLLSGAHDAAMITIDGHQYAAVVSYDDDSIHIIQVTKDKPSGGSAALCGYSVDCSAPSISRDSDGDTTDGFSINGDNLATGDRFNDVDTTEAKVGQLVTIKVKGYDSFGTDALYKANLYFDMPNAIDWGTAAAAIKYDIGDDESEISDANDNFDGSVSSQVVGDRVEITYKIMFTDEMDKSHIAIQLVDDNRNYQLIYFKNALEVTGTPTQTALVDESGDEITQTATASVPAWVKNTAGWWADGAISEGEFVNAVDYLIQQQIIDTDAQTSTSEGAGASVPDWVKNTAGWWADGAISEGEFVNAIEHLVKTGTIIII